MKRYIYSSIFSIIIFLLSACLPAGLDNITPTVEVEDVSRFPEFIIALEQTGANVEVLGDTAQPFFPVSGQIIRINGIDVQVYEFGSVEDRQETSENISGDASVVGGTQVDWVAEPHIWAKGRLIVLYTGQDEAIIDLVSQVMGGQIASGAPDRLENYPQAVQAAMQALGEGLGIEPEKIQVESFEQREWPDACLGLPEEGEACAEVITPGWQVILRVNGQTFDVHTNETGSQVRWEVQ